MMFCGIGPVVNMARNLHEGKQTCQRVASVARRFLQTDLYFACALLKDEHLCSAVRARRPVVLAYPNSPVSNSITAIATRLAGGPHRKEPAGGLFRKVIGWLN